MPQKEFCNTIGGRAEVVIASPDFRVRPNADLGWLAWWRLPGRPDAAITMLKKTAVGAQYCSHRMSHSVDDRSALGERSVAGRGSAQNAALILLAEEETKDEIFVESI
jgi:hypothetical protein